MDVRRELDSLVTQMHSSGIRYEDAVREFKKQYLREVLMAHRGNQCKAAEELGMHRNTLSRAMAELGLDLAEVRAGLKRPPRSERPVLARHARSTAKADAQSEDMLTSSTTTEARVAIEPGFAWDAQDAYLFDIDGTLLRSRDRVHVDSFASSVQRVTGFEITLAGILLHGSTDTAILREACHRPAFRPRCWSPHRGHSRSDAPRGCRAAP